MFGYFNQPESDTENLPETTVYNVGYTTLGRIRISFENADGHASLTLTLGEVQALVRLLQAAASGGE
jgi:hypothetical protein